MDILQKTENFYYRFKGEKRIIGKSLLSRPIYCFTVRKTEYPIVILQYSIHAREYITAYLALKQIERFIKFGKFGTAHFIPIVNPDGVYIALNDNPLYKANARLVDLNVNFDAGWGKGEKNVYTPSSENYIGKNPFSEPETKALRDFTIQVRPTATISYHSKGEEIYWEYGQSGEKAVRDFEFAKSVAFVTGYQIKRTPYSSGGYKDWCINSLSIPALTIEVGEDCLAHPIKEEDLHEIYIKNRLVPETVTRYLWEKRWN